MQCQLFHGTFIIYGFIGTRLNPTFKTFYTVCIIHYNNKVADMSSSREEKERFHITWYHPAPLKNFWFGDFPV